MISPLLCYSWLDLIRLDEEQRDLKTVLVTGAAGTMGTKLAEGLAEKGFFVRGLVLPGDAKRRKLDELGCEVVEGDITKPESLEGAFCGVDIVYHLAAIILSNDVSAFERINVDGTKNVLDAAERCGVGQFIHVSSASVVYPWTTPYSRSKIRCEEMVRGRKSLRYTIVRPTLVYDRDGGQEFLLFLKYLKMFPLVPFVGKGRALKNPVHVDDVMQGLLSLAENPKAYDKVYNFAGGQEISIRDLAKLMLAYHDARRPFVSVPVWLCKLVARLMAVFMTDPPLTLSAIAGLIQDANLDSSNARRDLGYDPISVTEGFRRCFGSERAPD